MERTLAVSIKTPPVGPLEERSGNASSPSDEQMREEQDVRDNVLQSLPHRGLRRKGNVTGFELLGGGSWSYLNNYLLLLYVDIDGESVVDELATVLPKGSTISVVGEYLSLESSQQLQA